MGRISESVEFIFCLSQSSQNFHLPFLSLSLFLFPSPIFPSMILSASIGNPPVSYYSPIVRHCVPSDKASWRQPCCLIRPRYLAISECTIDRETETTCEGTRRRKVERIKKERAGKIVSTPEHIILDFGSIVNRFDRKKHPCLLPSILFGISCNESPKLVIVPLIENRRLCHMEISELLRNLPSQLIRNVPTVKELTHDLFE